MKKIVIALAVVLTITACNCESGTRDRFYKVRSMDTLQQTKVVCIDTAYTTGDVVTLPGDTTGARYTVIRRVE